MSTKPKGIAWVLPDTEIVIKEEMVEEEEQGEVSSIMYEDIGGLRSIAQGPRDD